MWLGRGAVVADEDVSGAVPENINGIIHRETREADEHESGVRPGVRRSLRFLEEVDARRRTAIVSHRGVVGRGKAKITARC